MTDANEVADEVDEEVADEVDEVDEVAGDSGPTPSNDETAVAGAPASVEPEAAAPSNDDTAAAAVPASVEPEAAVSMETEEVEPEAQSAISFAVAPPPKRAHTHKMPRSSPRGMHMSHISRLTSKASSARRTVGLRPSQIVAAASGVDTQRPIEEWLESLGCAKVAHKFHAQGVRIVRDVVAARGAAIISADELRARFDIKNPRTCRRIAQAAQRLRLHSGYHVQIRDPPLAPQPALPRVPSATPAPSEGTEGDRGNSTDATYKQQSETRHLTASGYARPKTHHLQTMTTPRNGPTAPDGSQSERSRSSVRVTRVSSSASSARRSRPDPEAPFISNGNRQSFRGGSTMEKWYRDPKTDEEFVRYKEVAKKHRKETEEAEERASVKWEVQVKPWLEKRLQPRTTVHERRLKLARREIRSLKLRHNDRRLRIEEKATVYLRDIAFLLSREKDVLPRGKTKQELAVKAHTTKLRFMHVQEVKKLMHQQKMDESLLLELVHLHKQMLKEMFELFDEDGGGVLDQEEVRNLAKSCGNRLNDQELRAAMRMMDSDGSGEVDCGEFYAWWLKKDAGGPLKIDTDAKEEPLFSVVPW